MSRSSVVGAALFALAAGACADPEEVEPPIYDAEMRVGTSDENGAGFIEIPDGTDVDLAPGAQGGFHVWINVSLHKISGRVIVERTARRVIDDELVLRATPQSLDVPEDAMRDWWQNPSAAPAFMCPTPIGLNVIGEEIEITVRLEDPDGEILTEDSVIVVPRCNVQAEFCQEICSG
jgi:hypothetical protein